VLLGAVGSPVRGSNVATFTASDVNHSHPDRGFVAYGGELQTPISVSNALSDGSTMNNAADWKHVHIYGRLDAWRTTNNLPGSLLTDIETSLGHVRSNKARCVIRFTYNFDTTTADATLVRAQTHIAELGPTLIANKDVISYIEAGFVGQFGEWWNGGSSNLYAERATIRDELYDHFPTDRYIMFRAPEILQTWYPNGVGAYGAGSGQEFRIGIINDSWASGNCDGNTFQDDGVLNTALYNYSKDFTQYAPQGGENADLGYDETTNDEVSGIPMREAPWTRGSDESWSWHRPDFNNANFANWWISQSVSGYTNRFDFMRHNLGFWLEYKRFACSTTAPRGSRLVFDLRVRNRGWNRIFLTKRVRIILVPTGGGSDVSMDAAGVNPKMWYGKQTSTQAHAAIGSVTIPGGAATGTHWVHVAIVDDDFASDKDYNVRPGNSNSGNQAWDVARGSWNTGVQVTVT
jgi:hypothetical protein